MGAQLAITGGPAHRRPNLPATPNDDRFDFSELRIFTSIPPYHYDVVPMRGLVVVYDKECLGREGIQPGKFYVRESQRPYAAMPWEAWLRREWEDRERRGGPAGRLHVNRYVVQVIRWPRSDHMGFKLESGFSDGPYHDWAFGLDIIGKVVGIYRPCDNGGQS